MALNVKEKILLRGASLWCLGEGMLGPLFAVFANRMGGNILDITWAWATYLIITGLASIGVGEIADKYSKEKLMISGYALNALFTFSYLLVQTPLQLFLVQAGLGVASAIASPTWSALYAEHENRRQAGLTWGLADGDLKLVTGVAIIIGGLVVNYYSFETLFWVMGFVQVTATIYQARILAFARG